MTPCKVDAEKLLVKHAQKIGARLVWSKYRGPASCEFVCWNDEDGFSLWCTSVKLYYTPERERFQLAKLICKDSESNKMDLTYNPPLELFPSLNYLKRIKYLNTDEHFKNYKYNPKRETRVAICLMGIKHSAVEFMKEETLRSICSRNKISLGPDVCF